MHHDNKLDELAKVANEDLPLRLEIQKKNRLAPVLPPFPAKHLGGRILVVTRGYPLSLSWACICKRVLVCQAAIFSLHSTQNLTL